MKIIEKHAVVMLMFVFCYALLVLVTGCERERKPLTPEEMDRYLSK